MSYNNFNITADYLDKTLDIILIHLIKPLAKIVNDYLTNFIKLSIRNGNNHTTNYIIVDTLDTIGKLSKKIRKYSIHKIRNIRIGNVYLHPQKTIADCGINNESRILLYHTFRKDEVQIELIKKN